MTIKQINYKVVERFEGSLFSQYFEPIHLSMLPREDSSTSEKRVRVVKKKWKKDYSVFANYIQDNATILEKAMDADWNNSKIPKFVKDPTDRKNLFVRRYNKFHCIEENNNYIHLLFRSSLSPCTKG